jgi:hypothetical protein
MVKRSVYVQYRHIFFKLLPAVGFIYRSEGQMYSLATLCPCAFPSKHCALAKCGLTQDLFYLPCHLLKILLHFACLSWMISKWAYEVIHIHNARSYIYNTIYIELKNLWHIFKDYCNYMRVFFYVLTLDHRCYLNCAALYLQDCTLLHIGR